MRYKKNYTNKLKEHRFNALVSHYKDTYDIHQSKLKTRNFLFYLVLILLIVLSLYITDQKLLENIIISYLPKEISANDIKYKFNVILTINWVLLFGFSIRYFQLAAEIKKQYSYMKVLEDPLSNEFYDDNSFTREGDFYKKSSSSYYGTWTKYLYTYIFPIFLIIITTTSIIYEYIRDTKTVVIDTILALLIIINTILYIRYKKWSK